jgi:magnesium transporter
MLCGLHGMNFDHTPLPPWRFDYRMTLAVIATACCVIHRGVKRGRGL